MLTQTSNKEKKADLQTYITMGSKPIIMGWYHQTSKAKTRKKKKEKKKIREVKREAQRYRDTAARVGWARSGEILRKEVRAVRASSRSTGMEMKLCFTEELLKREVWDDWREPLKKAPKGAHHVNLFWLWVQVSSFIYKNIIELWVMETELWKQNYCLSNNLFAMGLTIFELWVMKTDNWVMKFADPNGPKSLTNMLRLSSKHW